MPRKYIRKDSTRINEKKARVLAFVKAYIQEHGYAPSYREIARELDIKHSCVADYVHRLIRDGKLKGTSGVARSLVVL